MKALLIQSMILLATILAFAGGAEAAVPETEYADTHDITLDITPVAITAKQRNMRYKAEDQNKHIVTMANSFCRDQNYSRVAESPGGKLQYMTAERWAADLPKDRPLKAWSADGMTEVTPNYATTWHTNYSDEKNRNSKYDGTGPAIVFTRLRCADKVQ